MKQEAAAIFKSENGKIVLVCDATTALGDIHDFLMACKGDMVDRMVKSQKEEEAISEKLKEDSEDITEEIEVS